MEIWDSVIPGHERERRREILRMSSADENTTTVESTVNHVDVEESGNPIAVSDVNQTPVNSHSVDKPKEEDTNTEVATQKLANLQILPVPVEDTVTSCTTTVPDENNEFYYTKVIHFGPVSHRIVLQNVNGACPLLAVVNALVLKGQLELRPVPQVSRMELSDRIADLFFRLKPDDLSGESEHDYAKHIDDVMSIVPNLGGGLDVNVRFRNVKDFEFTPAQSLFDLLGLNLYHGWLVDPQLTELVEAMKGLSYNEAIVKSLDDSFEKAFLVREFLETTASQLSYYGLEQLNSTLKDGEVAVLFRNNHFSTLHKRRDELFLLCTDSGFATEENVVWETLNNVDGDCYFVNHEFRTFRSVPNTPLPPQNVETIEQTNEDLAFAMRLQEEERVLAEREGRESAQRQQESHPRSSAGHSSSHPHSPSKKDKSSCSIQ